MKFYHSFPRVSRELRIGEQERRRIGIEVLHSMLYSGLVLTPEPLEIPPNPDSDLADPPRTSVLQRRACFTLLDRTELIGRHAGLFGQFAIGLDTRVARRLGIVPTFYYYRVGNGRATDSGISQQILFRLAEVRRLLIALAHVESRAHPGSKEYRDERYLMRYGLTLDDEPEVAARLHRLSRGQAAAIASALSNDRVPAWNLAEWIELILSMFQTADSAERDRHLAYFSQREWRIIQLFADGLRCVPLAAPEPDLMIDPGVRSAAERARSSLAAIVSAFRVEFDVDACFLLVGSEDHPFRDFVSEIVAPAEVADDIVAVLGAVGMGEEFEVSFLDGQVACERSRPAVAAV